MSLENKIEELTIVISALTVAISKVLEKNQPAGSVTTAEAESKSTTKTHKKDNDIEEGEFEEVEKPSAKTTKTEKPSAKTTKTEKPSAKTTKTEKSSVEEDGLPEGERDAAFFNAHIRPLCVDVLTTHGDDMKELAKKLGADRLSNVDPKHWGKIHKTLTKWLAELEADASTEEDEEDDF